MVEVSRGLEFVVCLLLPKSFSFLHRIHFRRILLPFTGLVEYSLIYHLFLCNGKYSWRCSKYMTLCCVVAFSRKIVVFLHENFHFFHKLTAQPFVELYLKFYKLVGSIRIKSLKSKFSILFSTGFWKSKLSCLFADKYASLAEPRGEPSSIQSSY